MACPGRSAARSTCEAVRCRAGAVSNTVFVTVPALRSGMKNAAPRPGQDQTSGRDIQLMIGMAGSTQPMPATT